MTRVTLMIAGASAACTLLAASPAAANCRVVGDSVAVGLGAALRPCSVSASVGLSAMNTARRLGRNDGWVIVALGSNDFPKAPTKARGETRQCGHGGQRALHMRQDAALPGSTSPVTSGAAATA
jgi:hypothetical protein